MHFNLLVLMCTDRHFTFLITMYACVKCVCMVCNHCMCVCIQSACVSWCVSAYVMRECVSVVFSKNVTTDGSFNNDARICSKEKLQSPPPSGEEGVSGGVVLAELPVNMGLLVTEEAEPVSEKEWSVDKDPCV